MTIRLRREGHDLAGVRIETARLTMRPPAAADLDALVTAIDHFDVARWLARVPHPYRREDAQGYLARVPGELARGADLPLHVFDADGLVGCVGLRGLDGGTPELGYWITPSRWRRGYAAEAVAAALDLGFGRFKASKVVSGVFDGNEGSLALQRRLGFDVTGKSRVFCLAQGRELDHIDTLLTRERHEAKVP